MITRYLELGPEHVDPDVVERAHVAVAVTSKALGLDPPRIRWVMSAPSCWAGKVHEAEAAWHGWVDTGRPDEIFLDAHRCAGRIAFAVAHELRHLYQSAAGWTFDRAEWEREANEWAETALKLPVA